MRLVQNIQMEIGEVDIAKIVIDTNSRDDIPQVLIALQHIYNAPSIREPLFELLDAEVAPKVSKQTGRPGMNLWAIFVCAIIRLALNTDFDRLHNLVNRHIDIRKMLGLSLFSEKAYSLQTLKDNFGLFTPELLDKINRLLVSAGHKMLNADQAPLRGRCDSFVVETNVEYPTDTGLLFESMRKVIELTAQLSASAGLTDWRQYAYLIRKLKRLLRAARSSRRERSKDKSTPRERKYSVRTIEAHQIYLDAIRDDLAMARNTLDLLEKQNLFGIVDQALLPEVKKFAGYADTLMDQVRRRVIQGETIPHEEKIFSIFEPHTEWICKGKVGVPVELGLRACILEDQFRFILHHKVMEKQTDDEVAVPMITETQQRFPSLKVCSFDKGFHSPENQKELAEYLDLPVLPRKGNLSKEAKAIEGAPEFVEARRMHSAVESAINGLEVHGLDRCLDHGIHGFKRYVAWAVVAKNVHRMGAILKQKQARQAVRRRGKPEKLAAA